MVHFDGGLKTINFMITKESAVTGMMAAAPAIYGLTPELMSVFIKAKYIRYIKPQAKMNFKKAVSE